MDLILLQLKRDIRSGWALLGLWWGLSALYLATALSSLNDNLYLIDHPDGVGRVAELLSAGWWVAGLLAAWWILVDPPADENAFWRARPLRWWQLLAAKAVLILIGLVLPLLLVHGVLVNALGAGGWWPAVLADVARTQLGWIVGTAALAALSGSWRRMLSIALACWVGGVGAYVLIDGLSQWGLLGQYSYGPSNLALASGALVVSGWLPVVSGVALVLQYAFRRPRWTVVVVLALSSGWMVLHMGSRLYLPDVPVPSSPTLPEFDVRILQDRQLWQKDQAGNLKGIGAILALEDPPPPYFTQPLKITNGHVQFSNESVRTSGWIEPWDEHHPRALREFQSAVPGLTIRNPNPYGMPQQTFITLVDYGAMQVTMVEKTLLGGQTSVRTAPHPRVYAGREGRFEADLVFEVMRHDPVVELPIEAGASWADGPNRIVMLGMSPGSGNRIAVTLRMQWLKLESDRSLGSVHCLLVNRGRGEAVVSTQTHTLRWVRIYPFATQDLRVVCQEREGKGSFAPIDDEWLAGASVRVVTRSTVGQAARQLRLEGFRLWPDPGELSTGEGG